MWKKIKNFLLDALFPVYCLGCGKPTELICSSCLKQIIILGQWRFDLQGLDKVLICFDYHQPLIQKAIKNFKYAPFNQKILSYLSPFLIEFLKYSPEIIDYLNKNNFVIVPVPLTKIKLAERGFNQAELIARELAQEFNWPLENNILQRVKNTPSQTLLNFEQREANVQNVFRARKNCPEAIILIDDVLTTGATLKQAAKTLRQAGAKQIWAFVLAKG